MQLNEPRDKPAYSCTAEFFKGFCRETTETWLLKRKPNVVIVFVMVIDVKSMVSTQVL